MSIDCRYMTNGKKTAYTMLHTDTGLVEEFASFDEIPAGVRSYFERKREPKYCGPDLANMLRLNSVFYPDWPKACGHPNFVGTRCIAESCKYADEAGEWENCPWFTDEKLEALHETE